MKAVVIGAAVALILATGANDGRQAVAQSNPASVMYASPEQKANRTLGPCDEERWLRITPNEWTPGLVKGLVRCTVRRWPVEGGAPKAIAVFECESSLFPFAIGGDNLGVAQHKASLWFDRTTTYLRPRWFSKTQWARVHQVASVEHPGPAFVARANIIVAVRMVHNGSWAPWSCAT